MPYLIVRESYLNNSCLVEQFYHFSKTIKSWRGFFGLTNHRSRNWKWNFVIGGWVAAQRSPYCHRKIVLSIGFEGWEKQTGRVQHAGLQFIECPGKNWLQGHHKLFFYIRTAEIFNEGFYLDAVQKFLRSGYGIKMC